LSMNLRCKKKGKSKVSKIPRYGDGIGPRRTSATQTIIRRELLLTKFELKKNNHDSSKEKAERKVSFGKG